MRSLFPLFLLLHLCYCGERLYIKRYFNPPPAAEQQQPPVAGDDPEEAEEVILPPNPDHIGRYSCKLDTALVEACIVKHQSDTRGAYQCYSSGSSAKQQQQNKQGDPCYSPEVTELADRCYATAGEEDSGAAFRCMFDHLGQSFEER